jgi:hypothetical protein
MDNQLKLRMAKNQNGGKSIVIKEGKNKMATDQSQLRVEKTKWWSTNDNLGRR